MLVADDMMPSTPQAHVCVQQTTLDLRELGYNVHLLVDGVSSRSALDRETAIVVCAYF